MEVQLAQEISIVLSLQILEAIATRTIFCHLVFEAPIVRHLMDAAQLRAPSTATGASRPTPRGKAHATNAFGTLAAVDAHSQLPDQRFALHLQKTARIASPFGAASGIGSVALASTPSSCWTRASSRAMLFRATVCACFCVLLKGPSNDAEEMLATTADCLEIVSARALVVLVAC